MKKKLALLLCTVLAVSMLGACGGKKKDGGEETTRSTSSQEAGGETSKEGTESASVTEDGIPIVDGDTPVSECITLGEYKGLNLVKEIENVKDEDIDAAIASELYENVNDPEYGVQEGDTVDIAFVGKKDGVAFDGGTSDSYALTIGSHSFIDGFEDGCIGMKLDETRDLNLKFPENYGSAELAGQDVVFTVTVNAITRPCELTDEWVAESYPEYATAEAFRAAKKEELAAANLQSAENTLNTTAIMAVNNACTFHAINRDYIEIGEKAYDSNYSYYALMYGMDLDTFIDEVMGREEYETAKSAYGIEVAKRYLIFHAIAEQEGWSKEDEDYQKRLNNYADINNMTVEDLVAAYGEESIDISVLSDRVLALILETAVISEEYVD